MNPIDQLEVEILELTGDMECAAATGDVARYVIDAYAAALGQLFGLPPEVFAADLTTRLAWRRCECE